MCYMLTITKHAMLLILLVICMCCSVHALLAEQWGMWLASLTLCLSEYCSFVIVQPNNDADNV